MRVIGIVGGERIEQLVKQLVAAVRSHDAQRRGEKNVLERQKFELFAVLIIGADDFEILKRPFARKPSITCQSISKLFLKPKEVVSSKLP